MTRWLHTIRTGVLVVSLAGALVHCGGGDGDGNGGGPGVLTRLFFGINGSGSCSNVTIDVDLEDAGAVLSKEGGDVQCTLDPGLSSKGCDVSFTEEGAGDRLHVVISGCTIPGSTNLFSCEFTDVDISEITIQTDAICTCSTPGCDRTPPLCIDTDADPHSCETCDNNRDDDGNGLKDCDDPNCENLPPCDGSGITTTTVSSTTSSTEEPEPLLVTFRLTSATGPVGALQLTVNYASAPGQFVGLGDNVECTNKVAGSLFAANDRDSIKRIELGWISVNGFNAPTDLVTCEFDPDTPVPVPSNFTIVVDDASDPDAERINVQIGVTVTGAP